MTMIDSAIYYASLGWHIFPLTDNQKVPREGSNGIDDATTDVERITSWWNTNPVANIAIATGQVSNLTVIDVDGQVGLDSYETIVSQFPKGRTRVIKTPKGHHLYFQYNPAFHTGAGFLEGLDVRNDRGYVVAPPSVVNGTQYAVMPDRDTDPIPITVAPEVFKSRHRNGTEPKPAERPTWVSDLLTNGIAEGQRDQSATSLAGYFHSKGLPDDIMEAVMMPFADNCTPPFSLKDLQRVIQSVSKYDAPEIEKSLSEEIRDWIIETNGTWWMVDELDKDIGIAKKTDKDNRRQILYRLKGEGFIEQHLTINKKFRHRVTLVEGLNFKSASQEAVLNIAWPLQIEDYVNLYPGNVAVIAGNSNAGKTAFMLNFIFLNDRKYPINYWCSEMEAEELGDRLDNFGVSRDSWRFHAFDRATDFEDIVVPDTINLIDYLDLDDNFFLVKSHLDKISRAIGKGMALVALQKKGSNELGYGADRSLATPKLYLSMAAGKMKIVKGKVPAKKNVTANGLQRTFQIRDGVYFVPDTNDNGWEYES